MTNAIMNVLHIPDSTMLMNHVLRFSWPTQLDTRKHAGVNQGSFLRRVGVFCIGRGASANSAVGDNHMCVFGVVAPTFVRVNRDTAQSEEELPAAAFGVLRDAARTRKVDAEVVEGAMVHLEGLSSSGQLAVRYLPDIDAVLKREYALVFSTATSFRPFQYIPVKV